MHVRAQLVSIPSCGARLCYRQGRAGRAGGREDCVSIPSCGARLCYPGGYWLSVRRRRVSIPSCGARLCYCRCNSDAPILESQSQSPPAGQGSATGTRLPDGMRLGHVSIPSCGARLCYAGSLAQPPGRDKVSIPSCGARLCYMRTRYTDGPKPKTRLNPLLRGKALLQVILGESVGLTAVSIPSCGARLCYPAVLQPLRGHPPVSIPSCGARLCYNEDNGRGRRRWRCLNPLLRGKALLRVRRWNRVPGRDRSQSPPAGQGSATCADCGAWVWAKESQSPPAGQGSATKPPVE